MRFTLAVSIIAFLCLLGALPATAQAAEPCASPANSVVAENCLPGSGQWFVEPVDYSINAFVFPPSVNTGEPIPLYFDAGGRAVLISVFRLGYYGGAGARLVEERVVDSLPAQPPCQQQLYSTGIVSCLNWSPVVFGSGERWVSGVYYARVQRRDTGGANAAVFVVRDDERGAPLLFQQSSNTFQAYNNFGGKSVYDVNSGWSAGYCNTVSQNPRAASVSLARPLGGDEYNNPIFAEYALLRWLEQQGYDMSYATNWDTHRWGRADGDNDLLNHWVFLSAGHDEYWSQEMSDAVVQARDAGVHLAFFSANTMYWRVRFEADPWTGTPDSVMTVYKTAEDGIADPSGHATSTFRSSVVGDPENALIGTMYTGDNDALFFPLRVSGPYAADRLYRHTDLQALGANEFVNIGADVIGWEWGAIVDNSLTPAGLDVLAVTPVVGFLMQDEGNADSGTAAIAQTQVTRYVAGSGAQVFSTGTILWGRGLGAHGAQAAPVDAYLQQMTYNALADMGLEPESPVPELILDGQIGVVSSATHPVRTSEGLTAPSLVEFNANTQAGLLASGRQVTFRWSTDRPTLGQVWLGPASGNTPVPAGESVESLTTEHQAVFEGLLPGVTYYVRVASVDADYNFSLSDEMTFTTPPNVIHAVGAPLLREWRSLECFTVDYPWVTAGGAGIVMVAVMGGIGWSILRRGHRHGRLAA